MTTRARGGSGLEGGSVGEDSEGIGGVREGAGRVLLPLPLR